MNDYYYVILIIVVIALICFIMFMVDGTPITVIYKQPKDTNFYLNEDKQQVSISKVIKNLRQVQHKLKHVYQEFIKDSYNQLLLDAANITKIEQISTDLETNFVKRYTYLDWEITKKKDLVTLIIEKTANANKHLFDSKSDTEQSNDVYDIRRKLLESIQTLDQIVHFMKTNDIPKGTKIYLNILTTNTDILYSNVFAGPQQINLPEYYTNSNYTFAPETLYEDKIDLNYEMSSVPMTGNRDNSKINDIVPARINFQKSKMTSLRTASRSDL